MIAAINREGVPITEVVPLDWGGAAREGVTADVINDPPAKPEGVPRAGPLDIFHGFLYGVMVCVVVSLCVDVCDGVTAS
jgi:hypothetical protein